MKIHLSEASTNRLHLGCGNKIIPGWINIDATDRPGVDYVTEITSIHCYPNTVDEIYICHVLEHFTESQVLGLLVKMRQWLKPNGRLWIAVPDFAAIATWYQGNSNIRDVQGTIMGGQRNQFDFHKSIFDEKFLFEMLDQCGFSRYSRYDWRDHDVGKLDIDDCSQCYMPHMDKKNGFLVSLNVVAQP